MFPISRDPPEGGTSSHATAHEGYGRFPISRDPPEGGTIKQKVGYRWVIEVSNF